MTTPSVDGRKRPEAQLLVVEDEPNILEQLGFRLLAPVAWRCCHSRILADESEGFLNARWN